jgi:hypothetical protein
VHPATGSIDEPPARPWEVHVTTIEQRPVAFAESKLNALVGKAIGEWGALSGGVLAIGDKLGLDTALANHGPATSSELACR